MLIDICLLNFVIYQGAVVPNCFKRATQTLNFIQKKGFVGCPVLSVIQALGVYGSIGVKYIKFQLELHFLFTALCLYNRYIYLI